MYMFHLQSMSKLGRAHVFVLLCHFHICWCLEEVFRITSRIFHPFDFVFRPNYEVLTGDSPECVLWKVCVQLRLCIHVINKIACSSGFASGL